VIKRLSDSNGESRNSRLFNFRGGTVYAAGPGSSGEPSGSYRVYDDFRMELTLEGKIYDGAALLQYDSQGRETCAFTLMSEDGLCLWGRQTTDRPPEKL
jgi:hypothetical protein